MKKKSYFCAITTKCNYQYKPNINIIMSNLAITNDIFRNSSGLMSELEAAISRGEVRRLERLGYIENAISPKGETWKLSKKGKASRDLLMGKRTFGDRISDFFYRKILGFRASI